MEGWTYGESAGRFGANQSGTEAFGYHWLAHVLYAERDLPSPAAGVAPGDRALQSWLTVNNRPGAARGYSWVAPTSYWYPPVFWQSPDRFTGQFMKICPTV